MAGVGWYLYRLLERLAVRDDLVLRLYGPGSSHPDREPVRPLPTGPAIEWVRWLERDDLVLPARWLSRLLRWSAPLLVRADGNEVVFAPNFTPPGILRHLSAPLCCVVHDLAFAQVPWSVSDETRVWLDGRLDATLRRAERVITISHSVERQLVDGGRVEADRVEVVPLAPVHVADRAGAGRKAGTSTGSPPRERYVLHVGTLEPRKNVETLLEAWQSMRAAGGELPRLVLCGQAGWKSDSLVRRIETARQEGWLEWEGYRDDTELEELYRGASAVVSASVYEGLGLPLLEAMAAGVPLAVSDIEVYREVAGDAALFVDPRDAEAWAVGIRRVLEDEELRASLVTCGRRRVENFDWSESAERTLRILRRCRAGEER